MKATATLLIRLMAIYVFAGSAVQIPASIFSLIQSTNPSGIDLAYILLYMLSFVVLALVVPLVLWVIAPLLASRISPNAVNSPSATGVLSKFDILRLGLILIGLYFIPNALAQFATSVYTLSSSPISIEVSQRLAFDQSLWQAFVSSGVRLVTGAVFIVLSAPIARLLEGIGGAKKER